VQFPKFYKALKTKSAVFNFFKRNKPKEVPTENKKEILIRYTYEWLDDIPLNERIPCNDFCAKLMELNRFYARTDIELISERVGYSVWDRRGAWIDKGDKDENGDPIEHPYIKDGVEQGHCKHQWVANFVKRKE
jgi:hypothetical protein